jgi:hypothetical protein
MAGPMFAGGLGRRAGFGAKLCLKRMKSLSSESKNTVSTATSSTEKSNSKKGKEVALANSKALDALSGTKPPKMAKDMDALITQELMVAYARGELRFPLIGIVVH